LPLSVVGGPIDGADDTTEVGTNGLLSECYFPVPADVRGAPVAGDHPKPAGARPQDKKKERSGLQSACDELIDKGAIHHR
jgi:hypothetical protein